MKPIFSRRQFMGATTAAVAAMGTLSGIPTAEAQEKEPTKGIPSKLYKARIADRPTEAICEKWKKAGFEGMEVTKWEIPIEEARKGRLLAETFDLRIHSVMRGWASFNSTKPEEYEKSIESVKTALATASAYGADSVLLVPCRVGGMKMPDPWDFDIDFDPKTLEVKTVAAGDNAPYADYIKAQNQATESTIRAVESLIPHAAKLGVRIALENVWNNLWCTPKYFGAFINYFNDPWIGCYFDLGNHTKYARCEFWLEELKHRIVKTHIKDFKITEVKGILGGGPGDWANIGQGSIDWKSVRKKLAEIGYNGWITIEENGFTDEEYSTILDGIIA